MTILKQNKQQQTALLETFVNTKRGRIVESMAMVRMMSSEWGLRVDWHEFSTLLDRMASQGKIERKGTSAAGLATYYIPRPSD